jgi:hypothetical protein
MAAAKVVRDEPIQPPIKEVILRLTEDEAKTLGALTGGAHGTRDVQSVYDALASAGFGWPEDRRALEAYKRLQKNLLG